MDERTLIDELVRCTEPERIIELVKLLVPDANDRTAELYARWTEPMPEGFADKVMDEPDASRRMQLITERFPKTDEHKLQEILRQIPYVPLSDEQRLYRLRRLRADAPETPENKYLADEEFSAEDWEDMPDEVYYMIRAMKNNPDLDPEGAARLVIETRQQIPVKRDTNADKNSSGKLANKYAFDFMLETSHPKRMSLLLNIAGGDDESDDDDLYDICLTHIRSIADPNFTVKSNILTEAHFAALCEEVRNS